MSHRSVYLAKHREHSNQRTHFAIFIPNTSTTADDKDQAIDFKTKSCKGTVIQVVGEPLMSGFVHNIKRNFDCQTSHDLKELVFLGTVEAEYVCQPSFDHFMDDDVPQGRLEREATFVSPPPKGQNIRAPIDGVNTKRCQEWTMEYLNRLTELKLISSDAVGIAQSHRDSATHGIFGFKA